MACKLKKKIDFTSCVYSLAFIPGLTSLAVLCVGQGEGGEEISKVLGIGYIYIGIHSSNDSQSQF